MSQNRTEPSEAETAENAALERLSLLLPPHHDLMFVGDDTWLLIELLDARTWKIERSGTLAEIEAMLSPGLAGRNRRRLSNDHEG